MKIINRIKAFFNFKGESQEMKLSGAEVRSKGVFLHPIDDPEHIFFVKSNSVDIFINNNEEISEEDVTILDKETVKKINMDRDKKAEDITGYETPILRPLSYTRYMPSKKRFSIMLYQDEYDTLMKNITEHGYKKAEYFLACMNSAKKQSFESTYKKYHEDHIKRHKADLAEAKRALSNSTPQPPTTPNT